MKLNGSGFVQAVYQASFKCFIHNLLLRSCAAARISFAYHDDNSLYAIL